MFDNSGVMRYRIETKKGRSLPLRAIGFYIIIIARCFKHTLNGGRVYAENSQGSYTGSWFWHAVFTGDESDAEGDAANRR